MDEVSSAIKFHNQQLIAKQLAPSLMKAKPAAEGEVREFGGKKHRKMAGKWVPVTEPRKKKQAPQSGNRGKKKEEAPKGKKGGDKPSHNISNQEIAQLTQVKKLLDASPDKAHEIAQQLSDEAKAAIPTQAWTKMMEGSDKAAAGPTKTEETQSEINEQQQSKFKSWIDKHRDLFDTGEHAHPERAKLAKFLRGKAKGIVKGVKNEIHHIKDAGKAIKNFTTGKPVSDEQKKALKKVGISVGLTLATMVATGGLGAFSHGAGSFFGHLGAHFVEHGLAEGAIMGLLFAKAEEEGMVNEDGEIDDADLERLVSMFIHYIENGDWSGMLEGIEGSEDSEIEE